MSSRLAFLCDVADFVLHTFERVGRWENQLGDETPSPCINRALQFLEQGLMNRSWYYTTIVQVYEQRGQITWVKSTVHRSPSQRSITSITKRPQEFLIYMQTLVTVHTNMSFVSRKWWTITHPSSCSGMSIWGMIGHLVTSGYLPGVIRFASSISIAIASRYLKESSSEKPYDISYEECSMSGRVPVLSQCRERTREDRANQKLGILSCGCASPRWSSVYCRRSTG